MHVHSPICQGLLIEKNLTDNFNSLGAIGRIEKKRQKKGQKNEEQVCFKQILKCDTCFCNHFSRAF